MEWDNTEDKLENPLTTVMLYFVHQGVLHWFEHVNKTRWHVTITIAIIVRQGQRSAHYLIHVSVRSVYLKVFFRVLDVGEVRWKHNFKDRWWI